MTDMNQTRQRMTVYGQYGPPLIFLLIAVLLLAKANLSLKDITDPGTIYSLLTVVVVCTIALAAAYLAKTLLFPSAIPARTARVVEQDGSRDRLARYVVIGGAVGIGLISVALLVAISVIDGPDISKSGMSIFTAVLPVFSTWVGTVIAFYFTRESFRQGVEAGGVTAAARLTDTESITRPGTMVPFERIVRYPMTSAFIAGRDAQAAAADILLVEISRLFQPPGIVRVVVFSDMKIPVFVLHHDLMPPPLAEGVEDQRTLDVYLKQGNNRVLARNFSWTASTATIADARRLLQLRKVTDLFVTEHGRSDEPVIGWVPDDNLELASAQSPTGQVSDNP